jgi:peptidoglycan/LPS O-acetylase OafA/YrhL
MRRLAPIEGLRAWLALWVLVGHGLGFSGYDVDGGLAGWAKLAHEGNLAVDLFIIVSGFVIFLLLDRREENYGQFICRRFFRLYPVYLPLLLLAIPLSLLRHWTVQHGQAWLSASEIAAENNLFTSAWRDWRVNLPAHLALLHGAVPDRWHGGALTYVTWLGPAWSISLEWQFYLAAPLVYGLATSAKTAHRLGLGALCCGLFYLHHHAGWSNGFLPYNVEFFYVGAASYFLYRWQMQRRATGEDAPRLLVPAICLAWMLFLLSGRVHEVIPLGLWLVMLAVLGEPESSVEARWVRRLFTHPAAQRLGQISYGIYLGHELVMVVVQAALLQWLPQLGQAAHFGMLLGLTLPATILVALLLHRWVEVPGMNLGRKLAGRLGTKAALKPLPTESAVA